MNARSLIVLFALAASWFGAPDAYALTADTTEPGHSPAIETDEAGLWQAVERIEDELQQSPFLVRDEALNAYVRKVVCDVAGPHCNELRVYIVDQPHFNAACYPNGMVQVWTGALLRLENEAQLAFLLGHEMTHYFQKHTLKQFRSVRDGAGALNIVSLALAGASVATGVNLSAAGQLISLGALGLFFQYSRSQEREADSGGFDLAIAANYEPHQASVIWKNIETEEAANPDRRSPSLFFASHPPATERDEELEERADKVSGDGRTFDLGADRYRAAVAAHRDAWLTAELKRAEFSESLAMIDRLLRSEPHSGPLLYYRAEALRLRNESGDLESAITSYDAAVATPDAPVAAYRGLGLAALKAGDAARARKAFNMYLEKAPDADDAAMVAYYKTLAEEKP